MVFNFTAKIFLGYDSENSSEDLSEKFNNIIDCLMSIPLNIPGTAFHECMKVIVERDKRVHISCNIFNFYTG